jgi:16S rRNA processing protein RimM
VRGELRVESLTDVEGRFEPGCVLHVNGAERKVERARRDRHGLLLMLEGIATRDDAEELWGALLEVPESQSPPLAEGSYYQHQVVGLRVQDLAGTDLGRIEEVLETGANDVYVVRSESGETLIPALDSVIKQVDIVHGVMVVELLEGLEQRPGHSLSRKRAQTPTRPGR